MLDGVLRSLGPKAGRNGLSSLGRMQGVREPGQTIAVRGSEEIRPRSE